MTLKEIFGDWSPVIDFKELVKVLGVLKETDPDLLCPSKDKIFRAFQLCPLSKCRVVVLGQDPYPQKGVATGLAFANKAGTEELSPSLDVIVDSITEYRQGTTFDCTLESWASQGILLLNSALTCEVGKIGSHTTLWQQFMANFIGKLSRYNPGLLYVFFGAQASAFKNCLAFNAEYKICRHPAFFVRQGIRMPSDPFITIVNWTKVHYNETIKLYGTV